MTSIYGCQKKITRWDTKSSFAFSSEDGPIWTMRPSFVIALPHLVYCITCFQSGLDVVRASTEWFVGVVVLWKQMIRCTRMGRCVPSFGYHPDGSSART